MNTSISVKGNNGVLYQPGHVNEEGYECVDVAGPPSARGCAENDINIDLIINISNRNLNRKNNNNNKRKGGL